MKKFLAGVIAALVIFSAGVEAQLTQGLNISGPIQYRVPYVGTTGSGLLSQSANFQFNGTTLGIGGVYRTDAGLQIINAVLTGATQYGAVVSPVSSSAATSGTVGVIAAANTAASSYTTADASAFVAGDAVKGAGSTITTQHGFKVIDLTSGTTNIGIRSQVTTGSNKYNLYLDGTANNLIAGHVVYTGTAPTMGACGTSPTIAGSDNAMKITVGTGGAATACILTFARTWDIAPVCIAQNNTDRVAYSMSTSTGGMTITATAAFTAGSIFHVQCMGY